MSRVLKSGPILICLLLAFAGCATGPGKTGNRDRTTSSASAAPAHPAAMQLEVVPAAPRLAPPAVTLPEWSPSQARSYADTWIGLERWSRESGLGGVRQVAFGPAPAFALSATTGVFYLRIHSLVANWNGLELHLGFEPQLIDGQPYVHFLDLKKTLEPLLRGFQPSDQTNRVIVIDPGHGGQNTGTISVTDGVYEKEYTLDWALRLEALLATNGWHVILTRTNDTDISLSNRVAIAEANKANLFISLHFNSAAPSEEQAGLETYCLTPTGMPSTLTRGYDDDSGLEFPNNAFDGANLEYAVLLHRALLRVVRNDRGIRHARFLGVLRGQNRAALLIEGGYLSNPADRRPGLSREARRGGGGRFDRAAGGGAARIGAGKPTGEAASRRGHAGRTAGEPVCVRSPRRERTQPLNSGGSSDALRPVLVTGGAGFIGSHLVERLLGDGHAVVVVDDLSTGDLGNLRAVSGDSRLKVIRSKLSACCELERIVAGASSIYHLAAAVGVELVVRSPIHTLETNLHETEVLLRAAAAHRVPVLVASSSEVYGKSERPQFSEDDDLLIGPPDHIRWGYACSKLMDEFLTLAYAQEKALPAVVARLFNTVGPRQTGKHGMVLPRFIAAARNGEPLTIFGDGSQKRCFCYITDTVEALVRLQNDPA